MKRYLCFVLGAITGGLATFAVMSRREPQPKICMIDIFLTDFEPLDCPDFEDTDAENTDIMQPTMEEASCTDS